MHIQTTDFNLRHTLESGQCFEWDRYKDGYAAIIGETFIYLFQEDDMLHIQAMKYIDGKLEYIAEGKYPKQANEIRELIRHYFSLSVNYSEILQAIAVDPYIEKAIQTYHGLRVVKQPHFSCFMSFLLSANTTIHNTKMARRLLSERFGKLIYKDPETGKTFFSLPDIDTFKQLSEQQLRECKTGFRAAYIHQAMPAVTYQDLELINHIAYMEAKAYLMRYKGIGEKIADCILIYSYDFENIYPTDTWVKKFTQQLYFPHQKISEQTIREFGLHHFNGYAGWAQLFLYIFSREHGIEALKMS